MKPLIVDNFLNQEEFDPIADLIVNNFQWKYDNFVDYADDKDKFQFTHSFYKDFEIVSPFHETLKPIWNRIRPREIYRVKANLLTRTPQIVENRFHTDNPEISGVIPYTTSIFYLNTNNGYTEFEDGTKVESVANRFVSFPMDMKHRGTSCTDEKTRVVINFNYLT